MYLFLVSQVKPNIQIMVISMYSNAPSSTKKQRFQLGPYQRMKKDVLQAELLKKVENDHKEREVKLELEKEAELQELTKKLHSRQVLISKRKRKVRFRTNNTIYFSAVTAINVLECNLYNLYYVVQTYAVINEPNVYSY